MLSHGLARLLLERRNNDMVFLVHLDDGDGETYRAVTTSLLGDDDTIDPDMRADGNLNPVEYDPLGDQLIIRLGVIVVSDPGDDE